MKRPDMFDGMQRTAVISIDGVHRYELRRVWDQGKPLLVVCMLNPSKADHLIDDPTILALIWFATQWGYGGLLVVNFYGFRSASPAEMFAAADPFGVDNEKHVHAAMLYARDNGGRLLAAWGNGGDGRSHWFCEKARNLGIELVCLGTTQSGAPKHPMARGLHRIPRDQQPITWRFAA